ncbi:MAG: transcription termination factor Rho [Verrucomicrobiales bacterium]
MPEETSIVPDPAPVAVALSDTAVTAPAAADTSGTPHPPAGLESTAQPAELAVPAPPPPPERVDLHAFQKNSLSQLYELGASLGLRVGGSRSKHQLVFEICCFWGRRGTVFECHGVIEVTRDGYGFVRDPIYSFLPQPDDVYMSPNIIRRFGLKTGNFVTAIARSPREKESFLSIDTVVTIEGIEVENWQPPKAFDSLTPLFPKDRVILENRKSKSVSTRVIDILAPLGKGQRALICAPPRGGKTILLKEIAVAIRENHPEVELMVLLLDERPEEVTDFKETVDSIVFASTFDQMPDRHMQVAEIVIARAQRLVERGRDVVVLLDSLTRLTRAYNNCGGGGGGGGGKARLTSGGVDPKALQRARKFFGAARNVEEGGSLTIVATALIETESRMDEVIFEEFKGTGNMELQLDRELVERRIFPAINMQKSATRNDDRLYHPEEFRRILGIRRQLAQLPAGEAMEVLVKNLRATQNNAELLLSGLRLS